MELASEGDLMPLQKASYEFDLADEDLYRAVLENAPPTVINDLKDKQQAATRAYVREWETLIAPRTPPRPIRKRTLAEVDEQRRKNRLLPPYSPVSSISLPVFF